MTYLTNEWGLVFLRCYRIKNGFFWCIDVVRLSTCCVSISIPTQVYFCISSVLPNKKVTNLPPKSDTFGRGEGLSILLGQPFSYWRCRQSLDEKPIFALYLCAAYFSLPESTHVWCGCATGTSGPLRPGELGSKFVGDAGALFSDTSKQLKLEITQVSDVREHHQRVTAESALDSTLESTLESTWAPLRALRVHPRPISQLMLHATCFRDVFSSLPVLTKNM